MSCSQCCASRYAIPKKKNKYNKPKALYWSERKGLVIRDSLPVTFLFSFLPLQGEICKWLAGLACVDVEKETRVSAGVVRHFDRTSILTTCRCDEALQLFTGVPERERKVPLVALQLQKRG